MLHYNYTEYVSFIILKISLRCLVIFMIYNMLKMCTKVEKRQTEALEGEERDKMLPSEVRKKQFQNIRRAICGRSFTETQPTRGEVLQHNGMKNTLSKTVSRCVQNKILNG